jgi:Sap-like sulfolipid-1-addressing protein
MGRGVRRTTCTAAADGAADAATVETTSNAIHRRTCRLHSPGPLRRRPRLYARHVPVATNPGADHNVRASPRRYRLARGGRRVQTLIVSCVLLGLAVAVSSPTSVLAVVVILEVTSGLRRGVAFVVGWVAAIALFGVVLALFPALDFQRSQTTPSRVASIAELLIGAALVAGAVVVHRRPVTETPKDPIPEWLTRLVGRHWAVAFAAGGFMLTYSLTIVAALEILKAHVGTVDRVVAFAVYGVTSIVTITAPIVIALIAPERAAATLTAFRGWLTIHSRTISVVLLTVIGLAIIAKAAFDLVS